MRADIVLIGFALFLRENRAAGLANGKQLTEDFIRQADSLLQAFLAAVITSLAGHENFAHSLGGAQGFDLPPHLGDAAAKGIDLHKMRNVDRADKVAEFRC